MVNPALFIFPVLLLASSIPSDVSSARILAIFPHIGKSHFFVFEPLMKALAARGHDVHVISHFPQNPPQTNYTDISIEGSFTEFSSTDGITYDMVNGILLANNVFGLGYMGDLVCESTLVLPQVQKLLDSNEKYDVVITELFNTDCFLGFAEKFQAPHIALSSSTLMPWASERFGNPDHPAYIGNNMEGFSTPMPFKERFMNTLHYFEIKLLEYFFISRSGQSIAEKYFGANMPTMATIARNTSLMLVNSHPSLNGVRPMVPAVVEVGGLHVRPPKKLPEDLDRWLNESRDGVVYFSMGSMLRSDSLPTDKRDALLQAFAELPQRVLWKWEGDSLPGQPDNVRLSKWLPQRDILNHPKVRLFMTHCGLLGVTEAVISAVPMVALPIFGDQHTNCKAIEHKGVAVVLQFPQISKESVLTALRTVLKDSSYQENADRLSKQFLDRPKSAMETAIFWTEYVIRHKGAHHLRSAAVELSWYQYLLLDVALVILLAAAMLVLTIFLAVRFVVRVCKQKCCKNVVFKPKQN